MRFQYLQYDLKKRLVPRNKEDDGYITVSPYHLVWSLDHYYLYCQFDWNGQERFLRMDKIRNARVLEQEPIVPSNIQRTHNLEEYTRNQAFMFGGKMEPIVLTCQLRMLDQVIDFFGEKDKITPVGDHHFEAEIFTSIDSGKFSALQYSTAIDEIRPDRLKQIVVDYLEDGLQRLRRSL